MGWRADHNYELTRDEERRRHLAAQPPLQRLRIRLAGTVFPMLIMASLAMSIAAVVMGTQG
jgi:hypothetical protein